MPDVDVDAALAESAAAARKDDDLPLDEEDRLAQLREHEQRIAKHDLERSSQVLRRGLPRPLALPKHAPAASAADDAAALVAAEMRAMLVREHVAHPPEGSKPASKALRAEAERVDVRNARGEPVDIALDADAMRTARDLLTIELNMVRGEKHGPGADVQTLAPQYASLDAFARHCDGADVKWDPRAKAAVAGDDLAALRAATEAAVALATRTRTATNKLEKRVAKHCGPLSARVTELADELAKIRVYVCTRIARLPVQH